MYFLNIDAEFELNKTYNNFILETLFYLKDYDYKNRLL